ncbi:hypothetical protein T492DRAFT_917332 [Pavlovales sp. CCMP2436]|nr:hypothetical protein T492DRAFT_917332 [Pavlovales sp. CCMP2436]
MLLPAATAVCALAAARCFPFEVLAGTSRPPVSLGFSSGCASRAAMGAAVRGGGPHAETPLKATKATTTMLLPTAAAGAAARGGGPHTKTPLKATKATQTMLLPALLLARLSALAPIAAQRGNTTNSNQQIISLTVLARAHYRRSIGTRGGAQASAAD